MIRCLHCGAETSNGLAMCERCQQTLTVALVNVAAYHADVLRIQPGERVKIRSTFRSTPPTSDAAAYDPISAAAAEVDNTVGTWSRCLIDDRPATGPMPADTQRRCAWLENHLPSICTLEWAGQLLRDMLKAERDLRRILDRADTGWYAGRCGYELAGERAHDGFTCACACHHGDADCDVTGGCGDEAMIPSVMCPRGLYASPGNNWIRCPECGTTWEVTQRRDAMMAEARDEIAPVSAIARAAVGLFDSEVSVQRLANRIDQWVSRGRLHHMGVRVMADGKPHRVYRLGDVFDLMQRELKPKTEPAC